MLKISKIAWLVFIGYIGLGIFTFFSIEYLASARDLFQSTEFYLQFNLIWFGLLITAYGLYALIQNYRRINRLGLDESLDIQFLIVLTFLFITVYAILDFYLYINVDSISSNLSFALESTGKVFLYGALLSGLLSIFLPKFLKWWHKSPSGV